MVFSKEWPDEEPSYILEEPVDYLELLSKYPIPFEWKRLAAMSDELRNQRSTSPDGRSEGGRCSLCHGPLLWAGTSGYQPHTRGYHASLRQRLRAVIALMLRSKVAGRKLW